MSLLIQEERKVQGDAGKNFEEMKKKVMDLYLEDEPLRAWAEMENMEAMANEGKIDQSSLAEFKEMEQMQILAQDVVILNQFLATVEKIKDGTDKSWDIEKDTEDIKIFYKVDNETKQMTIYGEKVIKAPMINLLAIIAEADLMKEWLPMMVRSQIVSQISHFRKLFEME